MYANDRSSLVLDRKKHAPSYNGNDLNNIESIAD
jgi:hypothetical protein